MSALGLPEASETTAPSVGPLQVLAGLLVVAVSVAAVWVVIAWGISTIGNPNLSVEEVEEYALVDLPADSVVLESSLASEAGFTVFFAEVALPSGSGDVLEGTMYAPVAGDDVPGWGSGLFERIGGITWYSADISGEGNEIGAATGTDADGRDILVLYSRLAE